MKEINTDELILKKPEDDEIEIMKGVRTTDLIMYVLDNI